MKLYGVLVVQNEADLIDDLLNFLRKLNIYEKIFFYDLGSIDGTFEKALKFKDILFNPQRINEPFSDLLKKELIIRNREFYKEGDWVAIIDVDEFYADNPIDLINLAEEEGASCIFTYQAQFQFTDEDLKNFLHEDLRLPIYERRKYYLIAWSEPRFFKFSSNPSLFKDILKIKKKNCKLCSKMLLNRHYQHRTPEQMKVRIKTRLDARAAGGCAFPHIFSENWEDYVIGSKLLHRYDGSFKFGIPEGVNWEKYVKFYFNIPFFANPRYYKCDNFVYNNASLEFLLRKGFITKCSYSIKFKLFLSQILYRILNLIKIKCLK